MSSDTGPTTSSRPWSPPLPPQMEDWAQIKDRKEKKRIQNRVAQRIHRHRMKSRLAELQIRIDAHEGRNRQEDKDADESSNDKNTKPSSNNGGSNGNSPNHRDSQAAIDPRLLPPSSVDQPPANLHTRRGYPNQMSDTRDDNIFQDMVRFNSNILPMPPYTQLPTPQDMSNDAPRISEDAMIDFSNTQTADVLRKPPHAQGPSSLSGSDRDGAHTRTLHNNTSLLTSEEMDSMEGVFKAGSDSWNLDAFSRSMQTTPPFMDLPHTHVYPTPTSKPLGMKHSRSDCAADVHDNLISPPPRSASLDERLSYIMECITLAGFETFDDVATTYYSANFRESLPIANEQRLSRNRRLPRVFGEMFQASRQWSAWERRGFHEEVMKTAEMMLVAESNDANEILKAHLANFSASQAAGNAAGMQSAMADIKQTMQTELPNLWALMMALATEDHNAWNQDQSAKALRTVLTLRYSSLLSND